MAGTGRFGGTGAAGACRSCSRGSRPTGQLGRREVLRCVLVGLLCVQEDPHLRPSMASVVVMLNSRSITLPVPAEPAFMAPGEWPRAPAAPAQEPSINEGSVSDLEPR